MELEHPIVVYFQQIPLGDGTLAVGRGNLRGGGNYRDMSLASSRTLFSYRTAWIKDDTLGAIY